MMESLITTTPKFILFFMREVADTNKQPDPPHDSPQMLSGRRSDRTKREYFKKTLSESYEGN